MRARTGLVFVVVGLATATVLTAGSGRAQSGGPQSPAGLCMAQQPCPPQAVGMLQIAEYESTTPIYRFGFGVSNAGSSGGSGGGSGRATFTGVSVTRLSDALSPQLFADTATGKHLKWVEITLKRGTSADATYRLMDVIITGFQASDEGEQVSFSFGRIELRVNGETGCYDLREAVSCS